MGWEAGRCSWSAPVDTPAGLQFPGPGRRGGRPAGSEAAILSKGWGISKSPAQGEQPGLQSLVELG